MTSYRPNRAAPSAPYGGTKVAMRDMAHTLAMEWAKHGIRVNSSSPGFVKTAKAYYVEKGARLGPEDELLWRYAPARNAAGARGHVCVFVERYC